MEHWLVAVQEAPIAQFVPAEQFDMVIVGIVEESFFAVQEAPIAQFVQAEQFDMVIVGIVEETFVILVF